MEAVLRPLRMTVTHYSCRGLLAQRPSLSNSDLARGAFVTRQSINVLLQASERHGYVTRPAEALWGKPFHAADPTRSTKPAFRILQSMVRSSRDDL